MKFSIGKSSQKRFFGTIIPALALATIAYRVFHLIGSAVPVFVAQTNLPWINPSHKNFIYMGRLLGCFAAVIVCLFVIRLLRSKPLRPVYSVLIIVLAIIPLYLRVETFVNTPSEKTNHPVSTLSLSCYLCTPEKTRIHLLFRNDGVEDAEVLKRSDGTYQVRLTMTDSAQSALHTATFENVGQYLCFFVDNEIKASAVIIEPIDGNVLVVPLDLTYQQAYELSQGILRKNYGL